MLQPRIILQFKGGTNFGTSSLFFGGPPPMSQAFWGHWTMHWFRWCLLQVRDHWYGVLRQLGSPSNHTSEVEKLPFGCVSKKWGGSSRNQVSKPRVFYSEKDDLFQNLWGQPDFFKQRHLKGGGTIPKGWSCWNQSWIPRSGLWHE